MKFLFNKIDEKFIPSFFPACHSTAVIRPLVVYRIYYDIKPYYPCKELDWLVRRDLHEFT